MSVIELLRQASAARAARFQYARAFDHFMDASSRYRREGKVVEAEGATYHAALVLRAYRAEMR